MRKLSALIVLLLFTISNIFSIEALAAPAGDGVAYGANRTLRGVDADIQKAKQIRDQAAQRVQQREQRVHQLTEQYSRATDAGAQTQIQQQMESEYSFYEKERADLEAKERSYMDTAKRTGQIVGGLGQIRGKIDQINAATKVPTGALTHRGNAVLLSRASEIDEQVAQLKKLCGGDSSNIEKTCKELKRLEKQAAILKRTAVANDETRTQQIQAMRSMIDDAGTSPKDKGRLQSALDAIEGERGTPEQVDKAIRGLYGSKDQGVKDLVSGKNNGPTQVGLHDQRYSQGKSAEELYGDIKRDYKPAEESMADFDRTAQETKESFSDFVNDDGTLTERGEDLRDSVAADRSSTDHSDVVDTRGGDPSEKVAVPPAPDKKTESNPWTRGDTFDGTRDYVKDDKSSSRSLTENNEVKSTEGETQVAKEPEISVPDGIELVDGDSELYKPVAGEEFNVAPLGGFEDRARWASGDGCNDLGVCVDQSITEDAAGVASSDSSKVEVADGSDVGEVKANSRPLGLRTPAMFSEAELAAMKAREAEMEAEAANARVSDIKERARIEAEADRSGRDDVNISERKMNELENGTSAQRAQARRIRERRSELQEARWAEQREAQERRRILEAANRQDAARYAAPNLVSRETVVDASGKKIEIINGRVLPPLPVQKRKAMEGKQKAFFARGVAAARPKPKKSACEKKIDEINYAQKNQFGQVSADELLENLQYSDPDCLAVYHEQHQDNYRDELIHGGYQRD